MELDWLPNGTHPFRVRNPTASATFDGTYLVDITRSVRGSAVVVDTTTGAVVLQHSVPDFDDGWATADAWLAAPWIVITETNNLDPFTLGIRAYRYDLRNGERLSITDIDGMPDPGFVWSVAYGHAVFDTAYPALLTSCLVDLELGTLTWSERWCGPKGWLVDWARMGPNDTVTFRLQEDPVPEREPCVRLLRISRAGTESAADLPLRMECKGFSGAGGSNWTLWSEVGLREPGIADSEAYVQLPDGQVASLGAIVTGSVTACGNWVLWLRNNPPDSSQSLLRWRPGEDVQMILGSPPHSLIGAPQCSDDWVTVMVAEQATTESVYSVSLAD